MARDHWEELDIGGSKSKKKKKRKVVPVIN
jgi:hypothetical protein